MAETRLTMTIAVRLATAADAAPLSELAATIFRETFARDNTPEDMALYLASNFTPDLQGAEIADPESVVLVAEHQGEGGDAELIGYSYLVPGQAPAAVRGEAPMEIRRFYVSHAWHGRGIARSLMLRTLDAARERGASTAWLGVWEHNPRAIAFYAKHGFEHVGEQAFMLGEDRQTDWLMARPLGR